MFRKITVIEPVGLTENGISELQTCGEQVIFFDDIPQGEDEIIRRIGDSDAVLLSYTTRLEQSVLSQCHQLRYVGMCCSLYSKESANVDIDWAEKHGIAVRGIRDYGDRGVVEFVLSELIRHLHGFDRPLWQEQPTELTRLPVGIVGLGVSGTMLAQALQFMGADVCYFSRTRKPQQEQAEIQYLPLEDLLQRSQVVLTCLNKNVLLLGPKEFEQLGTGKILVNTSIGPAFHPEDLRFWLNKGNNRFICDSRGALGDDGLLDHPDVYCADCSAGRTKQASELLSRKVLDQLKSCMPDKI